MCVRARACVNGSYAHVYQLVISYQLSRTLLNSHCVDLPTKQHVTEQEVSYTVSLIKHALITLPHQTAGK